MGETAQGGPIQNKGFIITDTGNHAPVVTTAPAFTIPTRTPFSLTGSATDADSDPLTYMWEQNDIGGPGNSGGTALVNNTKVNGPLFRQFGVAAQVSATDTLLTPSPGENHVDTNPTRVFPDMAQIVSGNTNAATGACPPAPPVPPTGAVPPVDPKIVDCFSEFLPTAAWVGVLSDQTLNFRLTARDYRPGGGGIGNAATKLTIAPLAGPFRVTAPSVAQSMYAQSPQTVTWDVAGTDLPPVSVSQVKISLSTDGGMTYPYVLADAVPNNGSARVVLPNVTADEARFKVESVGNVFFDISHTDVEIVAAPTGGVSGSVPATLSLSLGTPAPFAPFKAGQVGDYDTSGDGHRRLDRRRRGPLGRRPERIPARPSRQRDVLPPVGAAGRRQRRHATDRQRHAGDAAHVRRAGVQRRRDAGLPPAHRQHGRPAHGHVREVPDVHAVDHDPVTS